MYINGLISVLGIVTISFSILNAQPTNTSVNYKKNYKKAQNFIYTEPDSVKFYANQALLVAKDNKERADAYFLLGKAARIQEWFGTAIHYYQKALRLYLEDSKKNKTRLALITSYRRQKKYNTALRLAKWVNRYLEENRDSSNLKSNYASLGNIFFNLSQVDTFSVKWTDSSLFYHKKSIAIIKEKFPKNLPQAYYNISFAYEAISPDSAIYYTDKALRVSGISDYNKVLYNLRLAQINYRSGNYKTSNRNLDAVNQIKFDDLNLKFMYHLYRGFIALNLKDLSKSREFIVKCDSTLGLMTQKAQSIVDKKGMSETSAEAYGEIAENALNVFKEIQDSAYLSIANEYQAKKVEASRKYEESNQLIVQKDSLLLSNTSTDSNQTTNQSEAKSPASGGMNANVILMTLALVLVAIALGIWWLLRSNRQRDIKADESEPLLRVEGINTDLLNRLAINNDYEQIYRLLAERIGVDKVEETIKGMNPNQNLTPEEKVCFALKLEGFSVWDISQMLGKTKKGTQELIKTIDNKVKSSEKPN